MVIKGNRKIWYYPLGENYQNEEKRKYYEEESRIKKECKSIKSEWDEFGHTIETFQQDTTIIEIDTDWNYGVPYSITYIGA